MNDEYLGHSDDRVKYSARYIGVPTAGMEPYFSATPNIIIKYNPSMLFNHDFYFPGSAYMSSEPQRYSEYGGFTSLDGPDSAFRMPRNARPMSCTWVSASNIEPEFGRRNMDIVTMKQRMPEGGWEYVTYPRLTAQTNDIGKADLTTWGSGTCEIYRFYQPQLTDMTLMGNNSNYTALRNFYCPALTSMKSSFDTINWGTAPEPHISHAIAEIENFYAPNLNTFCAAFNTYDGRSYSITSLKNVNVGLIGPGIFQNFGNTDLRPLTAKRYITNYTSFFPDGGTRVPGFHGYYNWNHDINQRIVLNGDIVLNAPKLSSRSAFTSDPNIDGAYFDSCDFGTQSATNVYLGPKDLAIYENNAISASACYTYSSDMIRDKHCNFGPYPVKFFTCFTP